MEPAEKGIWRNGWLKGVPANFISMVAGNLLNKLVSVAAIALLTQGLGPAGFGRYSFVVACMAFFGIFTELGLNAFVTRDISAGGVERAAAFGDAIILRALLTVLAAVSAIASILLLGYPADTVHLALAASLSLVFSFRGLFFRTVFDIPFQAGLRMRVPAVVNFLNELVSLSVIFWLVSIEASLLTILLALNIANIPFFLWAGFLSFAVLRPRFRFDAVALARMFKDSLPLGAASVLEGVFVLAPVFLLSRLAADYAVGVFSLPFRIAASLWLIPTALMSSMLPGMSVVLDGQRPNIEEGLSRGLKSVMMLGVPLSLLASSWAEGIVHLIAGEGFRSSIVPLKVMAWGTLFYFMTSPFLHAFIAAGRMRLNLAVWSVNAAVLISLCAYLVPLAGHMGAAIAYTAALGSGLAVAIAASRGALGVDALPSIARFTLPAALAIAAVHLLSGSGQGVSSAAGLFLYASVLLFTWQGRGHG